MRTKTEGEVEAGLLLAFLDDLRHARSLADVTIAAGAAHSDLIEVRRAQKRRPRHAIAAVLVIACFLAFTMAFHPGVKLDHLAHHVVREAEAI